MKRRDFIALLSATSVNALAATKSPHDLLRNKPSLTLPQDSPTPAAAVRFAALGDTGTGENNQYSLSAGMAAHHERNPFDTVLMLGDNIYPDGDPKLFKDKFERPNAELLRRGVRFYAALGNHDVRRGREAQMKYSNFNMSGQPYYSFVKGDGLIEFFALDSTNITLLQLRWLDEALSKSKAQWKIAYLHHPLYSSAITHGSDTKLRALIEPLFVKYGVAAALSGHDHTYERTKPQRGVNYFVSGAGGQLRKGDLDRRTPFFATGNDSVNSFVYFEVAADKLSFRAMDPAGNTLDSGALTRARSAAAGK